MTCATWARCSRWSIRPECNGALATETKRFIESFNFEDDLKTVHAAMVAHIMSLTAGPSKK